MKCHCTRSFGRDGSASLSSVVAMYMTPVVTLYLNIFKLHYKTIGQKYF